MAENISMAVSDAVEKVIASKDQHVPIETCAGDSPRSYTGIMRLE
jgi:hypothetical protein